jgi:hypothetical protein
VQRHPLLQLIGSELVARAAKQILRQNLRKVLRLSALPSSVYVFDYFTNSCVFGFPHYHMILAHIHG